MAGTEKLTGRKKKSKKKRIIGLIALAGVLGVGGFFVYKKFFYKEPVEEFAPQPVIESAVRMDVEKLYNSTGKMTSGAQASIGANVTGNTSVVVDEVFVSIGDMVKTGDTLYTLDMSSVENELAIQQQKMALQAQLDAIEATQAGRALEDAQYQSGNQYNSATKKLERSAEDVNEDIVEQILTAEDVLKYTQEEADTKAAYEALKWNYEDLEAKKNQQDRVVEGINNNIRLLEAEKSYIQGKYNKKAGTSEDTGTSESSTPQSYSPEDNARIEEINISLNQLTYDAAQAGVTLNELTTSFSQLSEQYQEAESKYETAKANKETAESAFKAGKKVIKTDGRLMEDLVPETNDGNREALKAEQIAREGIATQRISNQMSAIDTAEELRKKKEMLENGVITAPIDGMVTGINVSAGKSFSGDNAIIINKLDRMHIIAEIDEAHIADITNGMLVRVKTDSTGEEVLTGKVVFSAPTPTEVQSSTSASDGAKRSATTAVTTTKATYRVEIELDEQNDRLRIGMTAKLEFVIASAKDCIAVPTACIMTDPDGSSYVRVATMPEGGADMSGDGAEETDFEDTEEIPGFTPIPEDDVIIEGGMSTGDEDMAGTGYAPAAGEMDGMIDESGMLIREVKVTTGVSDGYYTEITSGNIQEGDMIESPEMDYGGMGGLLDGIYG